MKKRLVAALFLVGCASDPPPRTEPAPLVIPPMASASASSAPVAAPEPVEEFAGGPSIAARDPRWAARKPRSRALMLTEAQGLERLLGSTATNAPDRPELLRRTADTYIELARTSDAKARSDARRKGIELYEILVRDHPTYASLDEVRYYLALEYELKGDLKNARTIYYDLIRNHPSSKLIPLAYFAFGEIFFLEAQNDPSKNDLAAQAFLEVIKYPAPTNTILSDALLRLAQTYDRKGEPQKAKQMLDRLLRDHPDSEAAARAKR